MANVSIEISAADIKLMRKSLCLTQKAFGALYGVSVDAVKSWESGRHELSSSSRFKLALVSNCPKDFQILLSKGDNESFWTKIEGMNSNLSEALEMMLKVVQGKETISGLAEWLCTHHPDLFTRN